MSNSPRPYARLATIKPGDVLITDAGFDCMPSNVSKVVYLSNVSKGTAGFIKIVNRLYVRCRCGKHMLDGQADEQGRLIGLRRPN